MGAALPGYAFVVARSRPDSFVDFRAMVLEDVPADVLAMYRVYAEGASVAKVAKRFGRPERRLRALFHDCGLPMRKTGSRPHRLALPPSAEELPRAEEAPRERDATARLEAAEREKQERRAAKAAARLEAAMPRIRAMYGRYEAGATLWEVGRACGVSESRVGQLFQRAGCRRARGVDARSAPMDRRPRVARTVYGAGCGLPTARMSSRPKLATQSVSTPSGCGPRRVPPAPDTVGH
jgi:hypothetical protein